MASHGTMGLVSPSPYYCYYYDDDYRQQEQQQQWKGNDTDDDNNNKQETKDYKSFCMFEIIRKTLEDLGNRYLA